MDAQKLGLKPGQEVFDGAYLEQMVKLRKAGFYPWSTEDVMDARNNCDLTHPLWYYPIDTDFGIVLTGGKIYIFPYSAKLRVDLPKTILNEIFFNEEDLENGLSFNEKDVILGRDLSEDEARKHPLWLAFARSDQSRLDRYAEKAFRFGKNLYNYSTMMGIYVPKEDYLLEEVVLRELCGGSGARGSRAKNYTSYLIGERRS